MSPESREYVVRIHEEGPSFWAEVLELPGCFATGDSLDELREAIEEAINLYVGNDPASGKLEPREGPGQPSRRSSMEIGEMRVKVPA